MVSIEVERPDPSRRSPARSAVFRGWAGADWPDRGGHLWPKDRFATTADGSHIAYAVRGPEDAPPILFCAGFLCPDNFWRDLGPALARDHRVVILNYRGVGASSEAGGGALPPAASGYTMELMAADVAAVADAEGIRDATVVGHSMGVQVALALWQARPEVVGSLALLAGPYASPLLTFYGSSTAAGVFPLISMSVPAFPRDLTRHLMRALELPITMPVARAIRALGPHTPDEGMRGYRWHMSKVDPRTAIWTARGMHAFDPTAWLDAVSVPAFVAVGADDAWAPTSVGESLADLLPDAELLVIPEGSHALPIEFPQLLEPRIRALTGVPSPAGRDGSHLGVSRGEAGDPATPDPGLGKRDTERRGTAVRGTAEYGDAEVVRLEDAAARRRSRDMRGR